MTTPNLYTDRLNGKTPRMHEDLPELTSDGLLALVKNRVQSHWLANQFPQHCSDGNGVSGTNEDTLWATVRAIIPDLKWPLWMETSQPDHVLFDLIEYIAPIVAKPIQGSWHSYPKHHELNFDEKAGQEQFRVDVNHILQRGGTVYELGSNSQIVRLGTPAVQRVVEKMIPDTGDTQLNELLVQARDLYQSRKTAERALGLEKLWDGFERIKTIDIHGDKKSSAEALLANINSVEFRDVIRVEMKALTDFGNKFTIRHHETDKKSVPPETRDYLFARMGSLIVFLLEASGRAG